MYSLCIYYLYQLNIRLNMKKLIEFKDLDVAIQEYADLYCDGNFSQAVRQLTKRALKNGI